MDELEKHIKSVRDELDINEPGPGLWSRIEAGLTEEGDAGMSAEGRSSLPGRKMAAPSLPGRKMRAPLLPGRDLEAPEPSENRKSLRNLLWRAAVAVIVAGAAIALIAGMLLTSKKLNDPQVTEVRETYRYYDDRIRELYREAEPLLTANPDISTELTTGMNELDSLSAQILRDLDDNIASGEVIEALIGNYRLRIELLEDMLRLMEENEIEGKKNNGNEL